MYCALCCGQSYQDPVRLRQANDDKDGEIERLTPQKTQLALRVNHPKEGMCECVYRCVVWYNVVGAHSPCRGHLTHSSIALERLLLRRFLTHTTHGKRRTQLGMTTRAETITRRRICLWKACTPIGLVSVFIGRAWSGGSCCSSSSTSLCLLPARTLLKIQEYVRLMYRQYFH